MVMLIIIGNANGRDWSRNFIMNNEKHGLLYVIEIVDTLYY